MHDLTLRIPVFFQLNATSQDLVIKEAERVLDPSKWHRNLRFGTRMALPTNRMCDYLHYMVKKIISQPHTNLYHATCHSSEIPSW